MNPQTRKNPLDGAKYREQYLSNLRLQASNDQRNQNANMVFKNTGQTPSKLPDTRTTTEKQSDIEALKVDLRSKLTQITDGVIASQIVGELTPDQIRFAVNNWGTIEPDMKRQFASGVPTSAFIAYLNRLIQKFQLTEGVETGLQQSSGNAIIMSNTQILYGLPRPQIWSVLRNALDKVRRQFDLNTDAILTQIDDNEKIVPTTQETQMINALPRELKAEVMTLLNSAFNNVISNYEVSDFVGELQIGLANRDKHYTEQVLSNILQTITLDDSVIDDLAQAKILIQEYLTTGSQNDPSAIAGGDPASPRLNLVEEAEPEIINIGSATKKPQRKVKKQPHLVQMFLV